MLWVSFRVVWRAEQAANSAWWSHLSALNMEGEAAPASDRPQCCEMGCPWLQEAPWSCFLGLGKVLRFGFKGRLQGR